ncbi:FeS assembly protein SufD [Spiroplasma syrphidicola EA-1]|uniref:FeS assembly protein SufD n=1 Tax=Spiroplasma syrphidicola EA-1 TaxID=1276229 RepID=R4UK76_9MOLU|nr:SufD family Fe-S cluster assembly protein [Spiroplasma syrphidicola]AGM26545.1 FeS assembly protein SufD [Spiroplasma syrphidicola EA-1]
MEITSNKKVHSDHNFLITTAENQNLVLRATSDNDDVEITIAKNLQDFTILLFCYFDKKVTVKFRLEENVNVNIINIYKTSQQDQNCDITYYQSMNSKAKIYDLNIANTSILANVNFELAGKKSAVSYYLASLAVDSNQKTVNLYAHHLAPQTLSDIKTYSIAKDQSLQQVKCTSHIEKTMAKSEAHQELRLLVFDKTSKAISDPILLIDENDIKASHANAVGMLDPDQIFYLQTRGLTVPQARKLICMGYFKNVIDAIVDPELQTEIINEIDAEIGE